MESPIIALMTDFGEDDFFVASLKGTILKICPAARIIDITHRVRSFDPQSAGFVLFACYRYFPERTIFLVIVDPGVGTSRKILLAQTGKYFFIAPDNGLLTLALEREEIQNMRAVENEKYFLPQRSRTFEGRDKMAPAAAHLARGVSVDEFGPEVRDFKKLRLKKAGAKEGEISGHILYTDKFGNLITNIPGEVLHSLRNEHKEKIPCLQVKGMEVHRCGESYAAVKKGELLFLVGSLGLVEIAAREDSASRRIRAKPGDPVRIIFHKR
ncbi:MAG: S-adenosyl-l-methionine hydroxide adenosyltransferase family protein [Candidatus Aminicenantales bacterium]